MLAQNKTFNLKLNTSITLNYMFGFLLYSLYLIGTISPFASGLSLIYVIVLFGLLIFNYEKIKLNLYFLIFIASFLIFYFLSYAIHIKTEFSNYKIVMFFVKTTSLLLIPCLITDYKMFFKGAFFALFLFVILTLFKSFFNIQNVDINDRIELGVLNPIWISRAVLECSLISIFVLGKKWKFNIVILLLCLPTIYVSGSKGPLLAFLIVIILKHYKTSRLKTNFRYLFVTLIFVLLFFKISQPYNLFNSNSYFSERFLSITPESSSEEIKAESRTIVWTISTINYLNQDAKHILFGQGVGNSSKLFYGDYMPFRFYPHNLLLEILFEQGLLFLIFFSFFIYILIRKKENSFYYLFLYYFINSMFSGDILLNEFVFFYLSLVISSDKHLQTSV